MMIKKQKWLLNIIILFFACWLNGMPEVLAQSPISPTDQQAINTLVGILKNPQQRQRLIEALETAEKTVSVNQKSDRPLQKPTVVIAKQAITNSGVMDAFHQTITSLQQNLQQSNHTFLWRLPFWHAVQQDFIHLIQYEQWPGFLLNMMILIAFWLIILSICSYIFRCIIQHLNKGHSTNWVRLQSLVIHLCHCALPTLIAWLIVYQGVSHWFVLSSSYLLALIFITAISAGMIFASLWLCLPILMQRNIYSPALVIYQRIFRWLFSIAFFASLSEMLIMPDASKWLGMNLAYLITTLMAMIALVLLAAFVLSIRRPISQTLRQENCEQWPVFQEALRLFSYLWYWPILILAMVSLYQLLIGEGNNQHAINRMILTTIMLIIFLVIMALVHRSLFSSFKTPRYAIVLRLKNLVNFCLQIILLLILIEVISRIWGGSIINYFRLNHAGQLFADALYHIVSIIIVTLLAWIIIDVAIARLLSPSRVNHGQISFRAQTILPLLRNAAKIILSIIAIITILANIGINIAPLLAGAGVIGLAIGFGSQTLVQDVISGIFNILEDTIAIGDSVDIDGRSGTVESMTIRTVSLRDSTVGALYTIPFSQVKTVKNLSRQFAYAPINLTFNLTTNIDHALQLVRQAAQQIENNANLQNVLLANYEDWRLEKITIDGFIVAGRFRTTIGGAANVRRSFYLALVPLIKQANDVQFASNNILLK